MFADRLLTASLALTLAASANAQTHVYVDDDAPAGGTGLSWQSAFNDLHDAIELANSLGQNRGEIRIAGGTYKPDRGTGNIASVFEIPLPGSNEPMLAIVGGYAGLQNPLLPDMRDIQIYRTVLDADLAGDDLPGGLNRTDNTERLTTVAEGTSADATLSAITLDGIRFRGAVKHAFESTISNTGIGFFNCVFEDNQGQFGAALQADRASILLSACTFAMNRSIGNGTTGGLGGAVYLTNSSLYSSGSVFQGNTTENSNGAAIAAEFTVLTIEDTSFVSNYSGGSGGAIVTEECAFNIVFSEFTSNAARLNGGALYTNRSSATLYGSLFDTNSTEERDGGAIYADHLPAAVAVVIKNCEFRENNAASDGGGLYVTATRLADIYGTRFHQNSANHSGGGVCASGDIENCQFSYNSAGLNGGGANIGEDTVVNRSTFQFNTAERDGGGLNGDDGVRVWYSEFFFNNGLWHGGGAARVDDVRYCDIEGNFSSQGGGLAYVDYVFDSEIRTNIASRGGGVLSTGIISACVLDQNQAAIGSAAYMPSNSTYIIEDSLIYHKVESGGSILYKNIGNPLDIVRSTIVRMGSSTQPMIFVDRGFTWIESSIIWDYTDSNAPTYQYGSTASAVYLQTISQFSDSELQTGTDGSIDYFGTNYDFDPQFVDAQDNDFRLKPNSPAIDSGFQETSSLLPYRDVYGDLRAPRDDAGILNTGLGVTGYLDIGAVEFQGTSCLADVNADGLLSPADFSAWIAVFQTHHPVADQNRDGTLTTDDFTAWIANYNTGCP